MRFEDLEHKDGTMNPLAYIISAVIYFGLSLGFLVLCGALAWWVFSL